MRSCAIATATPPFGGAVELRQHDARHAAGRHELAGLDETVLADGGVEHEQHLMRGARHLAADDATNLVELGHEIGARVEPARGVHEHDVAAAGLGGRHGVERHGGRVGA